MGRHQHGGGGGSQFQAVHHIQAVKNTVEEAGGIAVTASKPFQGLHREGTDGIGISIPGVGSGPLPAMLDHHNRCLPGTPVSRGGLIRTVQSQKPLRQVILLPGTQDNIAVPCHRTVIQGDFILILPVIRAVVNVKDNAQTILFCQGHCL